MEENSIKNNSYLQILQSINVISNKINALEERLNQFSTLLHNQSSSNIDYLAMMVDVEIPSNNF